MGGAAARGDHPAIIDSDSGETTTYAELAAKVDAVAAALQAQGIGKGDVVALVGPNSAEWAIVYYAILRAGGVVTPMNPLLTAEEMQRQQEDSGAKLAIDDPVETVGEAEPGRETGGDRGRSGGPGRSPVLERHHRPDEGCDADPPQPGGEHRAGLELDAAHRGGHAGRPAPVLPHLRPDRRPQHGPRQGIDDRHHAALRPRGAAGNPREASGDLAPHRPARRPRLRHRPRDRGSRHLPSEDGDLGRRAARRGARPARGAPDRRPDPPGLRDDRAQPGEPQEPARQGSRRRRRGASAR